MDAKSGVITRLAGNGREGYSGDDGPARDAQIGFVDDLIMDSNGNLFLLDISNIRIRMIDAQTSTIRTVGGNGQYSVENDDGPATQVGLGNAKSLALDAAENLYLGESSRIRYLDLRKQTLTTVFTSLETTQHQDGTTTIRERFGTTAAMQVETDGNLLVSDTQNRRIFRLTLPTGKISMLAGNGKYGFAGDGVAATESVLGHVNALALDGVGNLLFSDSFNHCIRKVDHRTGLLRTVIGVPPQPFAEERKPPTDPVVARETDLSDPKMIAFDAAGNGFLVDDLNGMVFQLTPQGWLRRVAGTGQKGHDGDGAQATQASLLWPGCVAVDQEGNLLIVETEAHCVRRVDAHTQIISTIVGVVRPGFSGDGGPAAQASLKRPTWIAFDPQGNLFIADSGNFRIRKVDGRTHLISTVAGTGEAGFSGDGGPATDARLSSPSGMAFDSSGNLIFADTGNNRIRRIDRQTGLIATIAGTGVRGWTEDGQVATEANLCHPVGIALDQVGNLFFSDYCNQRIRMIDRKTNSLKTIAGTGQSGFAGDGGQALQARLHLPCGVTLDGKGNLYIGDWFNHRLRRVTLKNGIITTVAGKPKIDFPDNR